MTVPGLRWNIWRVVRFILELGVLLAVTVYIGLTFAPVVLDFLPRGRASYDTDRRAVQLAVDEYLRGPPVPGRTYPTFSGSIAAPGPTPVPAGARTGPFVDFALLIGPGRPLVEPPRSAGPINATGIYTGSYNWYLDPSGQVQSIPPKGDGYP